MRVSKRAGCLLFLIMLPKIGGDIVSPHSVSVIKASVSYWIDLFLPIKKTSKVENSTGIINIQNMVIGWP